MGSESPVQFPKINLSGLDMNHPSGDAWTAVRTAVISALDSNGCFEALYDSVTPELVDVLFGHSMEDFFSLPSETKKHAEAKLAHLGLYYHSPKDGYDTLFVEHAPVLDQVQHLTRLMWPDGNSTFCNTIWKFAKHMEKLDRMIRRMILQSWGLEKLEDSHLESTIHGLRLSKYWVPSSKEVPTGIGAHKDVNMLTIICQHKVGLEVQSRDSGEWIHVMPSSNSFFVMVGESFEAWSNGRLKPPLHRVRINGDEMRYSAVFGSLLRKGYLVQAPEELIDEEHPQLFKPFDFGDYIGFKFTSEGKEAKSDLKDYCGVSL